MRISSINPAGWEDYFNQYHSNFNENEGWICPKCRSVYSPYVKECEKCNSKSSKEANPFTDPIGEDKYSPTVFPPVQITYPKIPRTDTPYIGDPLPGQSPTFTC
jgi:hypothetical protein